MRENPLSHISNTLLVPVGTIYEMSGWVWDNWTRYIRVWVGRVGYLHAHAEKKSKKKALYHLLMEYIYLDTPPWKRVYIYIIWDLPVTLETGINKTSLRVGVMQPDYNKKCSIHTSPRYIPDYTWPPFAYCASLSLSNTVSNNRNSTISLLEYNWYSWEVDLYSTKADLVSAGPLSLSCPWV